MQLCRIHDAEHFEGVRRQIAGCLSTVGEQQKTRMEAFERRGIGSN